jgi:hypothetical protein
MTVVMVGRAEDDLEQAYAYYHGIRRELPQRFMTEFRRGIESILTHPRAWAPLDADHRRFRLQGSPMASSTG